MPKFLHTLQTRILYCMLLFAAKRLFPLISIYDPLRDDEAHVECIHLATSETVLLTACRDYYLGNRDAEI